MPPRPGRVRSVRGPEGHLGSTANVGRLKGADDLVERLERLSKLKADGLLSDEEFSRAKDQLLGTAAPQPEASTAGAELDGEDRAASVRQVRASVRAGEWWV